MWFWRKKKEVKSAEQIEQEREERIERVSTQIRTQLISMNKKKDLLVSQVVEAKRKGLPAQEKQARGLLSRCLVSIKRIDGMLMTIELAVQSRDLAKLNCEFVQCIGDLADDISASVGKTDSKKAEGKYMKALYNANHQLEQIDKLLEAGDYAATISDAGQDIQFEEEIDVLVKEAENGSFSATRNNQKIY